MPRNFSDKGDTIQFSIDRGIVLAGLLAIVGTSATGVIGASAAVGAKKEYYELRIYRIENAAKQKIVSDYLEKALVPALGRQGLDRVGVFTVIEGEADHSIFVLIPYPTLGALSDASVKLAEDSQYQELAKAHFAAVPSFPVRLYHRGSWSGRIDDS